MFFNTFITAGFRPRNQNAKSIQGKFQVTTIGVVSCRTDVMPWYLDKTLDSSSHVVYNINFGEFYVSCPNELRTRISCIE